MTHFCVLCMTNASLRIRKVRELRKDIYYTYKHDFINKIS